MRYLPVVTSRMLTPRQVAEMLNVHPSTVGRWQDEGRIQGIRTPGGHRRFREEDILALLESPEPVAS